MTASVYNSTRRGQEMAATSHQLYITHAGKNETFRTMATSTNDHLARTKSEGAKIADLIGQFRRFKETLSLPSSKSLLFYDSHVRDHHMVDYAIFDGLEVVKKVIDECGVLLSHLERMLDEFEENDGVDYKKAIDELKNIYHENIQEFEKRQTEYFSIMAPGRPDLTTTVYQGPS